MIRLVILISVYVILQSLFVLFLLQRGLTGSFRSLFIYSATLKRSFDTTYPGFKLNDKLCDDDNILKELRLLYIIANVLIWTYNSFCDWVRIELFKPYCTSLYCSHLLPDYKKSVFSESMIYNNQVVYNNAFKKLLKLPYQSSATAMFANTNVYNFEALLRSKVYSFF